MRRLGSEDFVSTFPLARNFLPLIWSGSVQRLCRHKRAWARTRKAASLIGSDAKFWHRPAYSWTLFAYCYPPPFSSSNSLNGGILQVPQPVPWQLRPSDLLFRLRQCSYRTRREFHLIGLAMENVPSATKASLMPPHCRQGMFSATGVHMIRLRSMENVPLPCCLPEYGNLGKSSYEASWRRTFVFFGRNRARAVLQYSIVNHVYPYAGEISSLPHFIAPVQD